VDTLGIMVKALKENGRLSVWLIGGWSVRFVEGARVRIFKDQKFYRGTVLPLKASGQTPNEEVDAKAVHWDKLEIRVNELCFSK
jgi:putative aminopeptidase FrvX